MPETRSGRATPIDTNEFDVICAIQEKFDELKAGLLSEIKLGSRKRHEDMFKNMRQDFANNWTLVIVLGFDLYISFGLLEYVLIDGVVK